SLIENQKPGQVGSLPARTTGPRPVSDPGCSSGVPTHEDDGQMPDRNNPPISALPEHKDDGYAIIIKPGHTKRGPAYPGNNHTPGKAGPHSCSISETASANTARSEEHTSELQSRENLVCRLLLEKK